MADPLSLASGVVNITHETLHATRLLLDSLGRIRDAPRTITRLSDDVEAVESTLTLLEGLGDQEWSFLGATVNEHSRTTIARSKEACIHFRAKLQQWTKHSKDGQLSWPDRTSVGTLKRTQVKATTEELQHCKRSINSVIGVAALYSSAYNGRLLEEIRQSIVDTQDEVKGAMTATGQQLAVLQDKLSELELSSDEDEQEQAASSTDKTDLLQRIENEVKALDGSKTLFEELLAKSQEEAIRKAARGTERGSTTITFGKGNKGFQAGVVNGDISGQIFGRQ